MQGQPGPAEVAPGPIPFSFGPLRMKIPGTRVRELARPGNGAEVVYFPHLRRPLLNTLLYLCTAGAPSSRLSQAFALIPRFV